jgi:hypothetical protein
VLRQRREHGRSCLDVEELHHTILAYRDGLAVGDLSLLLWAEARMRASEAQETAARLELLTRDAWRLNTLEGMEAAWFVIGSLESAVSGSSGRALFDRAYAHLMIRRSRSSPLFRHTATDTMRAALPNFATQIYTLLALGETARHQFTRGADQAARDLADKLIELRLPDNGWPWLFHADRAVVVEPYEIYSVHQDAMAPMALFALAEAVGDRSYARAAVEGFQWCFGKNALGFTFYDGAARFAHRSIKRRGFAHSFNLWANAALRGELGLEMAANVGGLQINRTCRPYHLGWILEAWSGREHLHRLVD